MTVARSDPLGDARPVLAARARSIRAWPLGPGALCFSILLAACAGARVDIPPTATADVRPATEQPPSTRTPFAPLAATPDPTPACSSEPGTWQEGSYSGVEVARSVPLLIYLPACYTQEGRLYPAIYVLHGKPYDQEHWPDLGLGEAIARGRGQGVWGDFLVVSPLLPEPLFSQTDGGPGSYEMEFLEGLVPSIEAAYRADPRPAARAVAGISRGGVWALEIAFRRPAEFPAVAALSPALQVNLARAAYDPMKLAGSTPDLPQAIFLGAGENDWARWETETLAQALSARGVPVSWALVPGVHADATWQALIPQMLAFLTQGWGIGP